MLGIVGLGNNLKLNISNKLSSMKAGKASVTKIEIIYHVESLAIEEERGPILTSKSQHHFMIGGRISKLSPSNIRVTDGRVEDVYCLMDSVGWSS